MRSDINLPGAEKIHVLDIDAPSLVHSLCGKEKPPKLIEFILDYHKREEICDDCIKVMEIRGWRPKTP